MASRLASSSSGPATRHGAHSLFGSASQAGFGRLPAMVVGNTGMVDALLQRQAGLPAIEPIVAGEEPLSAHGRERERAQKRRRPAHVIDRAVAARGALGARGAPLPLPLVAAHGRSRIVRASPPSAAPAPPRPRSPWRRPGRDRAASDGRHPPAMSPRPCPSARAARGRRAPICANARGAASTARAAGDHAPAGYRARISARSPGALQPGSRQSSRMMATILMRAPLLHRIVHEVGIAAQPEIDRRRTLLGGPARRREQARARRYGGRSAGGRRSPRRRRRLDHSPSAAISATPRSSNRRARRAAAIGDAIAVVRRSPRPGCRAAARYRDARARPPAARFAGRRDG